jgi:flagellar export protein FliJ
MKPFRFRLHRLLRLNEAERRQRAIALEQKNAALRAEEQHLARLQGDRRVVEDSYAQLPTALTRASDWTTAQNALVGAGRRIAAQSKTVADTAAEAEKVRITLIAKAREVETLRRLRRRRRKEYDLELRRDVQKQNDEKAIQRFARSRTVASGKKLPPAPGNSNRHRVENTV